MDLLGRGGIALNGDVTRAARLDDGDELYVGGFVLRAKCGRRLGRGTAPGRAAGGRPGAAPPLPPAEDEPPPAADALAALPPAADAAPPPPDVPAEGALAPAAGHVTTGPWLLPGAADEALSPLVLHLTRVQQQMAEQFRMTMTGMFNAFREMHRDQMRVVCQELARVQQLTDELTSLRAEMADRDERADHRGSQP